MATTADIPQAPGRIARNAAVRSGGEVISKAASLVFFVTMARALGRDGFGAFMFALGLTGALMLAAGFGTDQLVAREVSRDRSRAGRYLADAASAKVVTGVVLLGLALAVAALGDFSTQTRLAVLVVGLGVGVEVVTKTWHGVFQAYERLDLVALTLILQRTLTAAVGVLVLVLGGGVVDAAVVFLAGALAALGVAEACARRILPSPRPRPDPRRWLPLLRAGVPIGLAGLLLVVLLRADVTLLSLISGEAEVGVYTAAYRLAEGTQFLAWSFTAAMLPWLARAERGGAASSLRRGYELGLKAMNGVLVPIGLTLVLFAAPVIHLLYGDGYGGSVLPLRLLGLTTALYGVQSYASITFIARDAPGVFVRLAALVTALNIGVNLWAIPRWGAPGAAAVALGSSILLATGSLALAQGIVGRARLARSFAGPVLAGGSMTVCVLAVHAPALAEAVAGLVTYAVVFAAVEVGCFSEDLRVYAGALPARWRARVRLAR